MANLLQHAVRMMFNNNEAVLVSEVKPYTAPLAWLANIFNFSAWFSVSFAIKLTAVMKWLLLFFLVMRTASVLITMFT